MTDDERKQYDKFVESPFSLAIFGSIPCLKGSYEYVYACRNNVATNGLTSGYYGSEEAAPKPNNGLKCSHGGGYDESDQKPSTGGISKDAATLFLAPHYYLHQEAAKLAVEATIQYLEDFRLSINDEIKFGQLIGIPFIPSAGIAIVLDTTESMKSHWNDVIAQVLTDMDAMRKNNPLKIIDYFLMPFNDPDFGFPAEESKVYQTNNSTEIIQKLNSLKPVGGGDIPEMCLPAILSTLKKVGPGVSVNIYTDANSKKPELLQQIGAVAIAKNAKLSFRIFGENLPNSVNFQNSLRFALGLRYYSFVKFQDEIMDDAIMDSLSNESTSTLQDYINLSLLTDGSYIKYTKNGKEQRLNPKDDLRNDWEIVDSVAIKDVSSFNYSFVSLN
uniref:VWFA domain-containing protein n=1 Tax=Panagrolaimus superbus TaxID=310955 RepID=A0A914YNM0_9BILA